MLPLGFKPKKSLGQSFLISNKIADRLVNALDLKPFDNVLEIGAGTGILTTRCAKQAQNVYAVEIDERLVPILQGNIKDFNNIEIIHRDILQIDWQKLGKVKVIGNIPYFISFKIIFNLLKNIKMWNLAVLTTQKEFARKLLASPEKPGYCATTVLFDYYAERKKLFSVSASMFRPSPKITSTAVLIEKRICPVSIDIDFKALSVVVQASFKQPRKTIANNLSMFLNIDKTALIRTTNLDLTRRAKSFSTTDFCQLTNDLHKSKNIYDESIANAFCNKS